MVRQPVPPPWPIPPAPVVLAVLAVPPVPLDVSVEMQLPHAPHVPSEAHACVQETGPPCGYWQDRAAPGAHAVPVPPPAPLFAVPVPPPAPLFAVIVVPAQDAIQPTTRKSAPLAAIGSEEERMVIPRAEVTPPPAPASPRARAFLRPPRWPVAVGLRPTTRPAALSRRKTRANAVASRLLESAAMNPSMPAPRKSTTRVFDAWTGAERAAFTARYLDHLRARDGLPELETRTFTVREAIFRELADDQIRRVGRPVVDPLVFAHNHRLHEPEDGLDEPTLWALCMAKVNRGERHGVDYKLARKGYSPGGADNPFVYIEIEETYHTRMLGDALRVIGIDVEFVPPRGLTRWVVEVFGVAPRALTNVVALDAELLGVVLFRRLLEKARALFGDQPAPLARVETLLRQILVDEVGHIYFLRSRLGPARLALARALLPLITRALLDDIPEIGLLFGRDRFRAEVMTVDVDAAVPPSAERRPPRPERPADLQPALDAGSA